MLDMLFLLFRASNYTPTHTTLTLQDMLLIPLITKNLLRNSKLTSTNPLSVEFCGNICSIKDMKGHILLQGLTKKDLYNLQPKSNPLSSPPPSHQSQFQLNKLIFMLSFSSMSSAIQNCNIFVKAFFPRKVRGWAKLK